MSHTSSVIVLRRSTDESPIRTARLPAKLSYKHMKIKEKESWETCIERACYSHQLKALEELSRVFRVQSFSMMGCQSSNQT
jgi:hypothetical protein